MPDADPPDPFSPDGWWTRWGFFLALAVLVLVLLLVLGLLARFG
jgi:hypothetical protein